ANVDDPSFPTRRSSDLGNMVVVLDRAGAGSPVFLETDACFMWHSLNAFELGDSIVADFVGYSAPDHFLGEKAAFRMIMEGRPGRSEEHTSELQSRENLV